MKKICIITGSRAEYGLFYSLLESLKRSKIFKLQLIVTGTHLSPAFGMTYREIEKDGFGISEKVDIKLNSDTPQGILSSMGLALDGLGKAIGRLKPDFVIVLGDRFETFCAATAAYVLRIPIVHLYGGESTIGVIDEAFRHSITKMSLLHFTSTQRYRQRVIQLGEDPKRVFNVGAIGIDNIKQTKLLSRSDLQEELGLKFSNKNILVTFHPITLEKDAKGSQFKEILKALEAVKDSKIIFTLPNADIGSKAIIRLVDKYVKEHPDRCASFVNLGRLKYLSLVNCVNAVVGNSSSGILEVPSLGKPTVNIGDRQNGRVRAGSVIQCAPKKACIVRALEKALSEKFSKACIKIENPYGNGSAANKIIKILKKELPKVKSLKKEFYDLKYV